MTTIGARLKTARIRAALSQDDLGKVAGVQPVTISRIENAIYGPPRLSTIRKLAKALGVTPSWLQFGDEVPSTPPIAEES